MDYLEKLPPAEKTYMKKFMSEYANATIKTRKDPLIKEYAEINGIGYKRAKKEMIGGGYTPIDNEGKPLKKHLHNTAEQAKDIFDSNNNRNNDVFGVTKVNNLLEYDIIGMSAQKDVWHETDPQATEKAIIEMLDYMNDPDSINIEYPKDED